MDEKANTSIKEKEEKMQKEIGVAFGGGGIRCVAHIGAVKALEELEYQIVQTAGTSGGAIVASLVAMGYTAKELTKIAYSLNWASLPRLKTILEKLWRTPQVSCKVVFTNLNGYEIVTDPTPEAVVCSCRVPVLPARHKKFLDGCLVNNLPTNRLTTLERIGLNVIPRMAGKDSWGYVEQTSRVNDLFVLNQPNMRKKRCIDIVPEYVNPFKSGKEIYEKLIDNAYNITIDKLSRNL